MSRGTAEEALERQESATGVEPRLAIAPGKAAAEVNGPQPFSETHGVA
jgi:hypothetical protein